MKRQINFSELMSLANRNASARLRSHRNTCFATYTRFENGKRIDTRKQIREFSLTWGQCLSMELKALYAQYEVVVTVDSKEVLRRIRAEQDAAAIRQEMAARAEFNSHLSYLGD